MEYLAPATVVLTALLLLSLIYRPILYLTIPAALAASLYVYGALNTVMGFPTRDLRDLEHPFMYLGHWSEEPTYLLAVPSNSGEPRLYALDKLNAESKQQLADSEKKTGEGETTRGLLFEGEYRRHNLDPINQLGPKQ
jgi:hypothetical protein